MSRRLVRIFLLVLPLGATPLSAQARFDLSVAPSVGALDPVGALPNARILASPLHVVSYDEVERMVAAGVALRVDDTRSPFGVRLALTRSFGGEHTGQWGCLPPADGGPAGCPDILILVPTDMAVTTAAASLTARVRAGTVELRGDLGAGWVRHAYSWDAGDVGSFSLATGKAGRSAATAHVGVGAAVPVPGGRAVARYEEIRAFAGSEDGRPNRWRALSVGLELGLFR